VSSRLRPLEGERSGARDAKRSQRQQHKAGGEASGDENAEMARPLGGRPGRQPHDPRRKGIEKVSAWSRSLGRHQIAESVDRRRLAPVDVGTELVRDASRLGPMTLAAVAPAAS
jgi:hypothetical protein